MTMQALTATGYGPPSQLVLSALPIPVPGEGQIQVRITAATINPTDIALIAGAFRDLVALEFPYVPGNEFAGTVTSVGPGVTRYRVGDEVFGQAMPRSFAPLLPAVGASLSTGALAEYAVFEAGTALITHRPPNVPAEVAASLAIAGSTAQIAMDLAALSVGETVLVIGATGAVGTTLLPLLARADVKIIATAARPEGASLVRRLGAHDVIGHDPSGYPSGADAVFNLALHADGLPGAARALRPGGRLVSIVFPAPAPEQLGRDDVDLHFVWDTDGTHGGAARVASAAASGELGAVIARRFSLGDGVEAAVEYATGHPLGKVVVTP